MSMNADEFLSQHGTIFKAPSGYVQQVPQVSIAMQKGGIRKNEPYTLERFEVIRHR